MGGKARCGGTTYAVTPGKCRVGGTTYSIKYGKCRVSSTTYNITFTVQFVFWGKTFTITAGTTWQDFLDEHGGDWGSGTQFVYTRDTHNAINVWFPPIYTYYTFMKGTTPVYPTDIIDPTANYTYSE